MCFFKKKKKSFNITLDELCTESMSQKYYDSFEKIVGYTSMDNGRREMYRDYSMRRKALISCLAESINRGTDSREFAIFSDLAVVNSSTLVSSFSVRRRCEENKMFPSDYLYYFLKNKYGFEDDFYEFCSGELLSLWAYITDEKTNRGNVVSYLDMFNKEKNPLLNYYDKIYNHFSGKNKENAADFSFRLKLKDYWNSFYAYISTQYISQAFADGVDASGEKWLCDEKYFNCCSTKFTKAAVNEIKKQCKNTEWLPKINLYEFIMEKKYNMGKKRIYITSEDEESAKKSALSDSDYVMIVSYELVNEIM